MRLIRHDAGQSRDFIRITDNGRQAARDPGFRQRLAAPELPKRPLHPKLEKVRRQRWSPGRTSGLCQATASQVYGCSRACGSRHRGSGTVGPYATALIAAGGVLVGGIITALSSLLIERQRRKQVDAARHAENSRELRQAVRTVLKQLSANSRSMLEAASQGAACDGSTPLSTGAWFDHQTVLAGYLSDEAWQWGSSASNRLAELGAKTSDAGSAGLE